MKLDAAARGQLLKDRRLAAEILLCLDSLWLAQSSYRYKRFGASGALGYLQDKPKLFEHIGVNLPGLCAMLFQYWTEVGSLATGEQWLRRATNGETFEDVASGTRFLHSVDALQRDGPTDVESMGGVNESASFGERKCDHR